jgi:hypothetical protein
MGDMSKRIDTSYKGTTADCTRCAGLGSYIEDFSGSPTVQVCTRCHNVDGLPLVRLEHAITHGQVESIARLVVELVELGDNEIAGKVNERIGGYDFAMAAKCVVRLQERLEARKAAQRAAAKAEANAARVPTSTYQEVPAGHYAVPSRTGNNDLDFWTVQVGKGNWAGRRFVKRVIGGHEDTDVRGAEARQALESIVKYGILEAGVLYGQTIGKCARCNRHLTDETSRNQGYGPECIGKVA